MPISVRHVVVRILMPVVLLTLAGYALRWTGLFRPAVLPYPHEILSAGLYDIPTGTTIPAIAVTLRRLLIVFAVALSIGGAMAFLFHQIKVLGEIFALPVDLVRSIPTVTLFPLFVTLWGFSETTYLAVPVVLTSVIMYVHLSAGLRSVVDTRRQLMTRWGATRLQTIRHLLLPTVAPHLFTAMRICISLQLILLLVAEMFLGARDGLGSLIYDQQIVLRYPEMYFFIAVAGVLGWLLNRGIEALERRVVFWEVSA